MKIVTSLKEALSELKHKDLKVFVHGASATPKLLLEKLVDWAQDSHHNQEIELFHLHTHGEAPYVKHLDRFRVSNFFLGKNMRPHFDRDRVDYAPVFLSQIPLVFRSRRIELDVALIQVSPPDQHGYCSLGTSVDVAKAAVENAKVVVAQINPHVPRVLGDGFISVDSIDFGIESAERLESFPRRPLTPDELRLGQHVAELIENGSTLQAGIGAIPDAVLSQLKGHKNLGLHSEMWSDGALELIESGVIDNSQKRVHVGKSVGSFVVGSDAVYKFLDNNPSAILLEADYVNSIANISRNPKAISINSAVAIDLTGQVCADSVGHRIISGVGGQVDFMQGAALSPGGKPIIAMLSRTKAGQSKFAATLRPGSGVVTTRAHVHYVATEFGVVDLFARTLGQRAKALISIAHPEDRDQLSHEWKKLH